MSNSAALRLVSAFLVSVCLQAQGVLTQIPAIPGSAAPSPRADSPIAYDPVDRQIIAFGGTGNTGDLNDLWAFSIDTLTWRELRPEGGRPAPRHGHSLVYDAQRRRIVTFAGQSAGFFNDVWAYDIAANNWQRLDAGSGPVPRYAHSAVIDRSTGRMVISHGFTSERGRFDDTWAFDLASNRWTNLTPPGNKPLRRCLHHAVLDESAGQMYLYGGCASGFGPCPLGDLWSFDLRTNQWREISMPSRPAARERYGIAYDPGARVLLLHGGAGNGLLSDVWHFDVARAVWRQARPSGENSAPRRRHESTFVPDLNAAVFFAGEGPQFTNDLLLLTSAARRPQITEGGVRNVFTGEGGPVSPLELVSIFGQDFGPSGGARVSVNNTPVEVLFANNRQINARLPRELEGEADARIVVTSAAGESSTEARVPVVPSAPGLFPHGVDLSGRLVTAENPAEAGSVVLLFGTGQGIGQPIRVLLAGREAELLYAGEAPGIPGLLQVNLRLPDGLAGSLEVILTAGSRTAPAITLFVR